MTFGVENSEVQTGDFNQNFRFYGSTLDNLPIEKGSYLRVFIPEDFQITDYDRVASTCTTISGFSDEIACELEGRAATVGAGGSIPGGHYLVAKGGFDSEQYVGGEFSFYISEIKNPFTTKPSSSFGFEIFDKQGGLQYSFTGDFTIEVTASKFSYVFVESQSPVNGVASLYDISLTLGVDTPAGAKIAIGLPEELKLEQAGFQCDGSITGSGSFSCKRKVEGTDENGQEVYNDKMLFIELEGSEPFTNGTTLTLSVGPIKNPVSFKPTSSFYFASVVEKENAGPARVFAVAPPIDPEQYWFVNLNTEDLIIKNSEAGVIAMENIEQENSELGAQTAIKMTFRTANEIP